MVFSEQALLYWLSAWLLPFIRLAATFSVAPVFSARGIPLRLRVLLAAALTWVMFGLLPAIPPVELFSWQGLLLVAQQVLIGLAMGFMLQMVFAAVTIAGESIAMGMGLGFAVMMDPQSGLQVPVVSQFYAIVTTLLFLALGGHLAFLQLVHDSFTLLPVGEPLSRAGLWQVVQWGSAMFGLGLLVALPVLISILLVNLAFGVITRAAPQLNIFAVGFPITLLFGMALMWLNWAGQAATITDVLQQVWQAITQMLEAR